MEIKQINDKHFREEAVKNFHWHDSSRRYEIHFTDLINCLLCTVKRKILGDNGTSPDEDYGQILQFVRGLGFDNMITERFAGKTTVWIDGAQGNIDMIFRGIPYELTSSIYVGNSVKKSDDLAGRYQYKLEQLKMYMAGLGSPVGRLKIIEVAGRPPTEHTWQISLSPIELAHLRIAFLSRKNILTQVLATGNITKLFEFRDTYTPIIKPGFCVDKDAKYCREWPLFQGENWHPFQRAWKEWLTVTMDTEEETPMVRELRRWM